MKLFILKITIAVAVIIVLVVLLVQNNKTPSNAIKVAGLFPLSGVRADAGELSKNALVIAEQEINSDKDRKHKISFVYEDTKYEPQTAVSVVRKLIDIDHVRYMIGPGNSSEALAVAPIVEKAKVLLIIHGAQTDEISSAGDYIFRVIHNMRQEAPFFAKFVASKMQGKTLDFIAINTAAIDAYIKNFKPAFENEGKSVGLVEKVDSKTLDFKDVLIKIKAANPSEIFILSTPKQTGLILKQAAELGIKAKYFGIGSEGQEVVDIAGKNAEGYLYPYSYDGTSGTLRVKNFYDKYVKMFGKQPDALAANSYDVAYLLSDCFEKVGDDTQAVKQCLYSVKDYDGASGRFGFDANGDAVKDIFVKTVRDGKFVRY